MREMREIVRIVFSKTAKKGIERMPKDYKKLLHNGILGLTKTPPEGDVKQMQGSRDERYRLRIGKYRVLFHYLTDSDGQYLYIEAVGSRGDIYK